MIENKIDEYLNEAKDPYDTIEGHAKGAIGALNDIIKSAGYGNMKLAKSVYQQLMKNLKVMEKFFK